MIQVTILDYAMKVLAKDTFTDAHPGDPVAATQAFAAFMGVFGQCTNGLSFFFSLVGTSFVIRRFGLRTTIMLFPTLCFFAMILVYMVPTLSMVFVMMLVLKALSYALNNPCKEILYQPTSKAVKFKAKSWIDIFGQRGSKALGSVVTNAFSDSAPDLLNYGSFVAMGVSRSSFMSPTGRARSPTRVRRQGRRGARHPRQRRRRRRHLLRRRRERTRHDDQGREEARHRRLRRVRGRRMMDGRPTTTPKARFRAPPHARPPRSFV